MSEESLLLVGVRAEEEARWELSRVVASESEGDEDREERLVEGADELALPLFFSASWRACSRAVSVEGEEAISDAERTWLGPTGSLVMDQEAEDARDADDSPRGDSDSWEAVNGDMAGETRLR